MNRQDKIQKLAEVFEGCGVTDGMASAMAKDILDRIFPPLEPIERDEQMNRTYIPMLGSSEIQTKGGGSTFRILVEDDRMPIGGCSVEFDFLEGMARYIRAQYGE